MTSTTTPQTIENPAPSGAPLRRSATTRSHRDDVAAIPSALVSEWTKLRTLRSNWAILFGTAAVGIVLLWVLAVFVKTDNYTHETYTVGNSFSYSTWLSTVMAVVAGILMFTSEVQHGTLSAAITGQPARWVTVAAKSAIAAGYGLATGAAGMLAGLSGGALGGLDAGDTSEMAGTAACGLTLTVLAAVFGLGIGMIVRHSSAAISLTLVWTFVIENLVRGFAPPTVSRYLPFSAANVLLNIPTTDNPEALAVDLTRVQNALLFGGYTVAALTIGTVLLYRRDMN